MGLDVECTSRRTRRDPLRLARRRFSPREVQALQGAVLLQGSTQLICGACCLAPQAEARALLVLTLAELRAACSLLR